MASSLEREEHPTLVSCTKCMKPLPAELYGQSGLTACPSCGSLLRVDAFPALFSGPAEGDSGETLFVDDEASCFYHPQKKAVVSCAQCGRFLCALCDVEFSGEHLCANCLGGGRKKKKRRDLETHRVLYDSTALSLSIIPAILWPVTFITAPMAMFMSVYYWRAPTSILPRTKARFVAAFLLGGIQVTAWSIFVYGLFVA